ncbi:MAG: crotonase [Firmicutes bacterium]|nr:crotonase [Bacillota bacterium]
MKFECFSLFFHEDWALLEMARPDKLNVIDEKALLELEEILESLRVKRVKAVVLTGQGKAFAAGADVKALAELDEAGAKRFSALGNKVFQEIEEHPAIFIAAVNGYAFGGGCELALACDLRFASNKASFSQPEINLGIIPGFGGTQRLPRIVGAAKAKELIFTAKVVSAEDALRLGLVNRVVEADQLRAIAKYFAEDLAGKSGPILALAKQAIGVSGVGSDSGHAVQEADLFGKCFATYDGREGIRAFLEKRSPKFEDR